MMTLGGMIERLERLNKNAVVLFAVCDESHLFTNKESWSPHSYRGYYERLGLEPVEGSTVGELLAALKEALGSTYEGYKGGRYTMGDGTLVHVANWGSTGPAVLNVVEQAKGTVVLNVARTDPW